MSFVLDASSLKTPQQLELAARAKAAALPPPPPPAPNPTPSQNPPGLTTQLSVEPVPIWDTSTIEAEKAIPVQPIQSSIAGPLSGILTESGMADKFNTPIPPEKQAAYDAWVKQQSEERGRDVNQDKLDYDVQGFYLSGQGLGANAHGPDTFKKPNHPTFSNQSQYGSGGGAWSNQDGHDVFTPTPENFKYRTPGALSDYWKKVEEQHGGILNQPVLSGTQFNEEGIPKAKPVNTSTDANEFDRVMPLPIFDGGKWSDEELRPPAGAGDKTSPVGNGVTPTFSPDPAAAASGPNAAEGLNNLPQNAPNATQVAQPHIPNAPHLPLSSFTYNSEARTDAQGNPVVYNPPKNDAGIQEIAGFTLADNPEQFNIIKNTPLAQRKQVILDLMDKYTAPAANWSQDPGVQGLLRDVVFHRGPGGAQAIIGMALGGQTQKSGAITPEQIQALNQMDPVDAIQAITEARKAYEQAIMGDRKNLSKGLDKRFNQARINFTKLHLNGDQS